MKEAQQHTGKVEKEARNKQALNKSVADTTVSPFGMPEDESFLFPQLSMSTLEPAVCYQHSLRHDGSTGSGVYPVNLWCTYWPFLF